ncbi:MULTISPECIES: RNA polymerase sigma factor [unclassified Pseudoalteromonas]|uniref:RNA polymerase sigma factor n=1 Tax=unclassified Pseudoalteromonas TaxID=194690 RepID=UPI001B3A2752|nr:MULTISPECIES: sigma-70 family RNA polymerase sigma factor [unclassified Pseudoalteromonas]MBQ4845264.1 sigma-70 family RNA polymerase sigma factor [Pseudoalteromonas sp. MMG005]MBQ4852176.1 sigma-70 family RNA polymerase sigma factor [Pseudoalteromonas sp. MMG012]
MLVSKDYSCADIRAFRGHSDFWVLWSEHEERLVRCCYKWLHNDIDKIEDAVAQACEKAYKAYTAREDDIENAFAWLCRIVHNTCMDVHRANTKQQELVNQVSELPQEFFFADSYSKTLESELIQSNIYHRLMQQISYLPAELRQVVEYKFMHDLEYPEIASKMKLSQENVRKRVQLARKKLSGLREEYRAG